jgi:hypothetical protein
MFCQQVGLQDNNCFFAFSPLYLKNNECRMKFHILLKRFFSAFDKIHYR